MKDVTQEQRWMQWLVQAQNFARAEQFVDALARAQLVRQHVQDELSAASGEAERERLERYLRRVDRILERVHKQRDEWYARIRKAYTDRVEHMEDAVKKPLPEGLPG